MAGKLKVEDALAKYIPGVPDDKKSITLHHLLTHTAGFVDALGDEIVDHDAHVGVGPG